MTTPHLLRVAEVAERLSLSPSKIYELVESGALPHHKIGGSIRVSEEQLARYLESTSRERGPAIPRRTNGTRPAQVKHLNAERLSQAWEKQGID